MKMREMAKVWGFEEVLLCKKSSRGKKRMKEKGEGRKRGRGRERKAIKNVGSGNVGWKKVHKRGRGKVRRKKKEENERFKRKLKK